MWAEEEGKEYDDGGGGAKGRKRRRIGKGRDYEEEQIVLVGWESVVLPSGTVATVWGWESVVWPTGTVGHSVGVKGRQ